MTIAILGIIAALVTAGAPLLFRWLMRRFNDARDPIKMERKRQDEADRAIARGVHGLDDVNRLIDDGLRQPNGRPPERPRNPIPPGGTDLPGDQ